MSAGLTIHTIGHAAHKDWPGVQPWGVATKLDGRIVVRMGAGAEEWGRSFVRNYAPLAISCRKTGRLAAWPMRSSSMSNRIGARINRRWTVAALLDTTHDVTGPAWIASTRDALASWLDGSAYLEARTVDRYIRWLREIAADESA